MARKRRQSSRAPAQEVWRQKKNLANEALSQKIMEKFSSGESIPVIDRETYSHSHMKPGMKDATGMKTPVKEPVALITPKEPMTPKGADEIKPLPEPKFSVNESYNLPSMPFKLPQHFIRPIEPTKDEVESRVDYDMDEEDMAWLEIENEKREQNGAPPVSMDDFEIIMDRFEKESYFELVKEDEDTEDIQDEDAVCCICMDGESQTYNEILFCEMCNLAVHQECYGIPYIPEGQWLCRKCLNSPSAAVDCVLCPSNTGALKMAEGGFWSHILCAIWVPEVQFANPVFLEPVECVGKIPSSRWKLTCQLCKMKGVGACIQCMQKKCNLAFHVTCGQQAGFYMKFVGRPGEPKTKSNHLVYCTLHKPESENDKFENFRQKMLKSVKTPITFTPIVPPERVQGIGDRVSFKNKNVFVKKLLAYWSLKRRCRLGVPLLQTNVYELKKKDYTESSAEGSNEEVMSEKDYKSCLRFRQDMEKVRLLLELVRKREKLKYELTKVKERCMELELLPTVPFLRELVDLLSDLDEENIFQDPVDREEVPNYHEVIKNPMDFSSIRNKINNYEYLSLEDFEKDFNLMIDNCLKFNRKNNFYYEAAINLRSKSKGILKKAKDDLIFLKSSHEQTLETIKERPMENGFLRISSPTYVNHESSDHLTPRADSKTQHKRKRKNKVNKNGIKRENVEMEEVSVKKENSDEEVSAKRLREST